MSRIESCLCFSSHGCLSAGTFTPRGVNRFIAKPVPVPLQGTPFERTSVHVERIHTRATIAQEALSARQDCSADLLFDSMLSETPGARQSLLSCSRELTHGLLVRSKRSAVTQTFPFSGLCVRFSARTLHLVEHPLPEAAVLGGWIDLTQEGFSYAYTVRIRSSSVMAQSLVNWPHGIGKGDLPGRTTFHSNMRFQSFYFIEKPGGGPDRFLQLNFRILFPQY